ncbi:MAG: hypothetical protein HY421_02295 [Candidatus Kerfeldbacteria bacterium]|nr:hypothetical protein [Candidatus Kerfeldbacteria bacterium]
MPAKIYSTHSTWIEGALPFAQWLANQGGVAYVNQGHVRSSHVRAGRKDPKFTATKMSVAATWYSGGQLQMCFIFPISDVTHEQLAQQLQAAWFRRQQRGGIGESSKTPVREPIKRPVAPATSLTEEARGPPKPPTPEVVVVTSTLASRAYQILLDQDGSGQAERFNVTGVSSLLEEELGLSDMVNAMSQLRQLGLLSKGQRRAGTRQQSFVVLRRPFEVRTAMHERGMRVGTVPVEFLEMDPTEHLAFFERHKAVIEEANQRRKALKHQGFEVTEHRGTLSLTKIHRTRP